MTRLTEHECIRKQRRQCHQQAPEATTNVQDFNLGRQLPRRRRDGRFRALISVLRRVGSLIGGYETGIIRRPVHFIWTRGAFPLLAKGRSVVTNFANVLHKLMVGERVGVSPLTVESLFGPR